MNITIACEGSPIFPATRTFGGPPDVTLETALAILEWFNSLTNATQDKAYFLEESRLFVFPLGDNEWREFEPDQRGLYQLDIGLEIVPACLQCLNYVPCDCEFNLLDADQLRGLEERVIMGENIHPQAIRDLIYMIRELEAQLRVEQE